MASLVGGRFRAAVFVVLLQVSMSVAAFMPAGGLWVVDSELTGDAGRGFQIEVENSVLVLTYYGYRSDGSSVFYLASGTVANNAVIADLVEYRGGRSLGGEYQAATAVGSVGQVTLSFSSGQHGTITLPGESSRSISKLAFGYPPGQDGLLGTWWMMYLVSDIKVSEVYVLNTKLSQTSSTGNGYVTNTAGSVACEYQVSGTLQGTVFCAETGPLSELPDVFNFKFSGDRGTGIGGFYHADGSPSYAYEAHMLRTATASGKLTGLNDGTNPSLLTKSLSVGQPIESVALSQAKAALPATDDAAAAAVRRWGEELREAFSSR